MVKNFIKNKLVFGILILIIIQVFIPLINSQPIEQKSIEKRIISSNAGGPSFYNITYPDNITTPSIVNISADIVYHRPISEAKLIISFPTCDASIGMTNIPGTHRYYRNVGIYLEGQYSFKLYAKAYIPSNGTVPNFVENYTIAYSIHGNHNDTTDVGFIGEVALVWKWFLFFPGIGDPRFVIPQYNISIEKNIANGTAIINEISFAWRINFEFGPYLLPRISGFYLNLYLDNKTGLPLNNSQYLLSKRNGYDENYFTFKNIPIPYNGLTSRTIWCKISAVPRLVVMSIPWLRVSGDKWIQINVNFNTQ
jgi:hypothetical protein